MTTTTLRRPSAVYPEKQDAAEFLRNALRNSDLQHSSPRRTSGEAIDRRNDMYLIIEDLARDRIREIRRDAEAARQVRARRRGRRHLSR